MEIPFVESKGMKALPLEEASEDELLVQPGAKAWETKIEWATESVDLDMWAGSYRAWRGFYLTAMRSLRIKDDLDVVRAANAYSEEILRYGGQTNLQRLLTFERKTPGRMGLSHEAKRAVNKQAPRPNEVAVDRKKQK